MKTLQRCWIAIVLVAILMPVDGSAARRTRNQRNQDTVQADPRIAREHKGRFFSQSGAKGCLFGAMTGALFGHTTSSSRNRGQNAAIGAVAGCAAGMGVNYYMDNKRARYANTEARLDAYIADLREDNRQLHSLNTAARAVIDQDRNTLAQLRAQIAAGEVQQAQARRQLAQVDANRAALNQRLAEARATRAEWVRVAEEERGSRDRARLDQINAEISRMARVEYELETQMDAVYGQRSSIRLS